MKRSNLICLLISLLGLVLIIGGCFYTHWSNSKESERTMKQREETIALNYEQLKQKVVTFSKERQQIYDLIFRGTVLTEIPQKQNTWYQSLEEYEKIVDTMIELGDETVPLCKITNTKQKSNNKCDAFLKAYETAHNAFVKDISKYNELILSYNEQKEPEEEPGNLYRSKYKEYVDINQDQLYEGKE